MRTGRIKNVSNSVDVDESRASEDVGVEVEADEASKVDLCRREGGEGDGGERAEKHLEE